MVVTNFTKALILKEVMIVTLFSMFETPTMSKHTNKYSNYDKLKNYKSSRTTFNEKLVVKFVNFL
jgi:hypothetical protein